MLSMNDDKEKREINKIYFLCRLIINEQALVSSRRTPIITPVGINILLFAKIIIQIGFSREIQSVFVLLLCGSLRRGIPKMSVENESWISLALLIIIFL